MKDLSRYLLSSEDKLHQAIKRLFNLFDVQDISLHPVVEIERDLYLVDRIYFSLRPDLQRCGKLVYGTSFLENFECLPNDKIEKLLKDFEESARLLLIPVQIECLGSRIILRWPRERISVNFEREKRSIEIFEEMAEKQGFGCLWKGVSPHNHNLARRCRWILVSESNLRLTQVIHDRAILSVFMAAAGYALAEHPRLFIHANIHSGIMEESWMSLEASFWPLIILHAAFTDAIDLIVDEIEDEYEYKHPQELKEILSATMISRKPLQDEASMRFSDTYSLFRDPKTIRAFQKVMIQPELDAILESFYRVRSKEITRECEIMLKLFYDYIMPEMNRYKERLKSSMSDSLEKAKNLVDELHAHFSILNGLQVEKHLLVLDEFIVPRIEIVRRAVDELEQTCQPFWPLASSKRMLGGL